MATVNDFLKCPKCGKQMMGKSHPQTFGKEYFANCCHEYFGVNELVNQFGYDAADLTPAYPVTHANYKGWMPVGSLNMLQARPSFSIFDEPEPYWDTLSERVAAYEMVNSMLLGIPEWDDYLDLKETQEYALQIGVQ